MNHLSQEKTQNRFKKISLSILGLIVVVFVGTKIYPIIHGPQLTIHGLETVSHSTDPLVALSGTAHFTKDLIINGTPLPTGPDGTFNDYLVLNRGYNLITMEGRDRFGNTTVKNYTLVLTENTPQTITMTDNESDDLVIN